uniref:Uncharacterized protein n=1 Tax=Romanomermis culicivorax TaxID=13658 RepID=A0A915IEQ7_ROMCU
MVTPSTSSASAADEPRPYCESMNINERYVRWAEQQPHQNDLSFCCDGTYIRTISASAATRTTSNDSSAPSIWSVGMSLCMPDL